MHQLRTYRVCAAFEVPRGVADAEVRGTIQYSVLGHELFNMRSLTVEEPWDEEPWEASDDELTIAHTWARIDAPASMSRGGLRQALKELYQGFKYPLVERSMTIEERPDTVDAIIDAREFRRGGDEEGAEPGADQAALHTVRFWWCSTPAEGEARTSAPKEGTFLAKFHSRGAIALPAVGDTVSLFAHRVKVIGRTLGYEYSDAYEYSDEHEDHDRTEVNIDIYVELPLVRPFTPRSVSSA
ncbi:hypothetical protein [Streptomyces violascens]|uniref:hypothetical protein n=1 Tax=Streptomyces violascens TaxID=67381 RepID=UPI00167BEAC9|nr:hypothetical protein [Streptomyces violascens]GGU40349.1 hypothetical protein GCM10010289_71450 [Streptomyces violascens]